MSWIVRMRVDGTDDRPSDEAERLAGVAWDEGSTGVAEITEPGGTPVVLAGFDDERVARDFAVRHGGTVEAVDPSSWQAPPVSVTTIDGPPSVVITGPAGSGTADTGGGEPDIHVRIDAAGTFGHGAHPTTTLALQLLVSTIAAGGAERVLDVGAGSGVLGIVAARLGADVTATEIDPHAHPVIAANADANGVEIELRPCDLVDVAAPDLAVVNVLLVGHRDLAPALGGMSASRLVLTGVLDDQLDELLALHPGRRVQERLDLDGWVAVQLGPVTDHDPENR